MSTPATRAGISPPAVFNVTNSPGPLIHTPSQQLFLIPVQIINPRSYRRWTCHMTPRSGPLPFCATVCTADCISWVKARLSRRIGRFMHFNWIGFMAPCWEQFFEVLTPSSLPRYTPLYISKCLGYFWLWRWDVVLFQRIRCDVKWPVADFHVRRTSSGPSGDQKLYFLFTAFEEMQSKPSPGVHLEWKHMCLRNQKTCSTEELKDEASECASPCLVARMLYVLAALATQRVNFRSNYVCAL